MPRWNKGQSGNPTGRPKRGLAFTAALRAQDTPDELAELALEGRAGTYAGEPRC
jgi:hypothetical protein